ncbi:MAG TPA: 3-methyl-2-oxobutanoate dehydrogenase subunit VorB [Clostridia bacterium]|nr:3-methyl-2-oxobutanoate dehydrogenase subunit VorB [Clostridia bacterium]HPQ47820.1 3-methyl-2-oxobutanoate dehydrogenase subunit VorB [Clostridia bacterium]
MSEKVLIKGNEAIGEAAIRAGCRHYFGYPITPQNELTNYMSQYMPEAGGVFIQAESEIAAINMVYGAAGAGARAMTSSSSPGISLKQEGISYIAGAEIPAVVVNVMRCGPGLGGIMPAQSDYFQAVKGGGHGDYRNIALAPCNGQELYELTVKAFDLADKYRMLVMVMADGALGQMMENVEFRDKEEPLLVEKPWAATGTGMKRKKNSITSVYINPDELEVVNDRLQAKYREIEKQEVMYEETDCDGADIVICAYGLAARITRNVMKSAAAEGIKVGLLRPITLWPFPKEAVGALADKTKVVMSVELSAGQMVEDVQLAINGRIPVYFHGKTGGNLPSQKEILDKIKEVLGKEKK